mmetsp:Transcript_16/g.28  ORF Transcript_16/g.28 Transcript_16/m.28 type:complete len:253 (+) Transcript_16:203-961(+)
MSGIRQETSRDAVCQVGPCMIRRQNGELLSMKSELSLISTCPARAELILPGAPQELADNMSKNAVRRLSTRLFGCCGESRPATGGLHGHRLRLPFRSRATSPTQVTLDPSNNALSQNSRAPFVPKSTQLMALQEASVPWIRCASANPLQPSGTSENAASRLNRPFDISNKETSWPCTVICKGALPSGCSSSRTKSEQAAWYARGGWCTPSCRFCEEDAEYMTQGRSLNGVTRICALLDTTRPSSRTTMPEFH